MDLEQLTQRLGEHFVAALVITSEEGDAFDFESSGGDVFTLGLLYAFLCNESVEHAILAPTSSDLQELQELPDNIVALVTDEEGQVFHQIVGHPVLAIGMARATLAILESSIAPAAAT